MLSLVWFPLLKTRTSTMPRHFLCIFLSSHIFVFPYTFHAIFSVIVEKWTFFCVAFMAFFYLLVLHAICLMSSIIFLLLADCKTLTFRCDCICIVFIRLVWWKINIAKKIFFIFYSSISMDKNFPHSLFWYFLCSNKFCNWTSRYLNTDINLLVFLLSFANRQISKVCFTAFSYQSIEIICTILYSFLCEFIRSCFFFDCGNTSKVNALENDE